MIARGQPYPDCDGDCGQNGVYCCDGKWDVPLSKAVPQEYAPETVKQAEGLEREFRRIVGKEIEPRHYPGVVRIWNRCIAIIHGIKFDTSHDRERGPGSG